ncbi:MAG: CoA pyrophosphatase [Clostridiales Family XIII bacterium]|nr:CoA pyrophosphatase [Clostridiales Family XIII bacterium]
MNIDLDKIKKAVAANVPGPIGKYRYNSVLIPLVRMPASTLDDSGQAVSCGIQDTADADELHILFEVRSDTLRKQPGEIGLPGGKVEAGETPGECAVRETVEELGIPAGSINLIGELNYIPTYSNFTMYSFAGEVDFEALKAAVPNRDEVKEIFYVPLRFFLENEPQHFVSEIAPIIDKSFPLHLVQPENDGYSWRRGTADVPIYTWRAEDGTTRIIWGLTARLVWNFAELVKDAICGKMQP